MAIQTGMGALDRPTYGNVGGSTVIQVGNPATATGVLNSFEVYANTNLSGLKMGPFVGSGTSWAVRDYVTIGTVTSGSKQTFTGVECGVEHFDCLGTYYTSGRIERTSSGGQGILSKSGDYFGGGTNTYTSTAGIDDSYYGTGISAPTVTTQDETDVTTISLTGNGKITDTGGSGSDVTRRGFCYMEGSSGDPTTANSTAYDDGTFGTGAYTKSITGLSPSTSYRVRAYAVNAAGTAYGTTVDATTDASGTLYLTAIMSHKFIPPFLGGLN